MEELRADRDVVMAAVENDPMALAFADESMRWVGVFCFNRLTVFCVFFLLSGSL